MFIKLRHLAIEKDENEVITKHEIEAEHIYDCDHITLFSTPQKEERDRGKQQQGEPVREQEMNLVIEFNQRGPEGFDRTISFPTDSDTHATELFIMNGNGKTVDRMIW